MKRTTQAIVSAIAALAAMALSGGASAQSTWGYGANPCDVPGACSVTSGTASTATATPYGYSSSGTNFVLGVTGTNVNGTATYSGLTNQGTSGIGSTGLGETGQSPDHAFDNRGGGAASGTSQFGTATTEMLLINFSSKVELTAITLGWSNTDSDLSILRWDGQGSPQGTNGNTGNLVNSSGVALSGTGSGVGGLTNASSGWTLVSSRDMDNTATTCATVGGCDNTTDFSWTITGNGGKVSSWWMISTYFGATTGSGGQTLDIGNDFFKILSFSGNVCQYSSTSSNGGLCTSTQNSPVPEPTSLALVSIALAGVAGVRRRRNLNRS